MSGNIPTTFFDREYANIHDGVYKMIRKLSVRITLKSGEAGAAGTLVGIQPCQIGADEGIQFFLG